jgi:2OG-Fe(II) oxygenase superfamily
MKNFIEVYDGAFNAKQCNDLIFTINELEKNSLLFQSESSKHNIDHKEINLHHYYDLAAWSCVGENLFPTLKDYVDDYLEKYSILQKQKFLFYDVKAKKIPVGGGFHSWHFESADIISSSRTLVAQLYLNTIKEGGETEFLYINKRVSAVQGRLIIFPGAFTHTHRGNPPIGEEKYILTTWGVQQG